MPETTPAPSGNKYHRRVYGLKQHGQQFRHVTIDVYSVLAAFDVRGAGLQHAAKKVLCAGLRGKGDRLQDLREARDAIDRQIEDDERGAAWPEPALRRTVYIAGPISKGDLLANVNRATAAFVALAKAGFAPLCPHWSVYAKPAELVLVTWPNPHEEVRCVATQMGNEEMTHSDWMGVDLPWVVKANALLRLPGESAGADLEEACAREHGIPVFESVAELVEHFARANEPACAHPSQSGRAGHWVCNECDAVLAPLKTEAA